MLKTYERLGKDKPHRLPGFVKEDKETEEAKRPLSPTETGTGIVANHSIDVKADGEADSVKVNDNVEVKRLDEDEAPASSVAPEDQNSVRNNQTPSAETPGKGTPNRKPGRPKKKVADASAVTESKSKPYEGLFDATVRMDLSPPMLEIKDLREGVEGGEKTWQEEINCLVCGSRIN